MAKKPKASTGKGFDPYTPRDPRKEKEAEGTAPPKTNVAEDAVKAVNLAKIKDANEALQVAKNNHQSVIKHAEAKGIHLAAAKEALKIKKSGKIETVVSKLSATLEYLFILGVPLDKKQLELFRVEDPRAPLVERAKQHGRLTGILGGGTSECPHDLSTAAGQAWMQGFHGGIEERKLVLDLEPKDNTDDLIKSGDEVDDPDDEEVDENADEKETEDA